MNIRLHQATTALLTGLLLIGGNVFAEDKEEPIKMKKVDRVKKITFDDPDRIYIFISPLQLASSEENKKAPKTWAKIAEEARKKEEAAIKSQDAVQANVRIFCLRNNLEGEYKKTDTFDFGDNDKTHLLSSCDTSRFIAREGATISVIYVDFPRDNNGIRETRKKAKMAKQDMEEAKKNEVRAQANTQTKFNKANEPSDLSTEKNEPKSNKKSVADFEDISEKADNELNRKIEGGTSMEEDKYCNESFELPSLISFIETKRDTLLMLQVKQILNKAIEAKSPTAFKTDDKGKTGPDKICAWKWAEYSLTKDRAVVQAEVINPMNTDSKINFNVITGGKEHFFLSVDAIFKDVKQLRAAAKSKDDIQGKPENVFLSLNYMVGDVYGTLPNFHLRRLVIKGLITPNQQFDSYGLGLGYRIPGGAFSYSKVDSIDHSGVVLFVGRFWTRPAKSPLDIPNTDSRRIASTSFGISYSLGAALDWLVPKK